MLDTYLIIQKKKRLGYSKKLIVPFYHCEDKTKIIIITKSCTRNKALFFAEAPPEPLSSSTFNSYPVCPTRHYSLLNVVTHLYWTLVFVFFENVK